MKVSGPSGRSARLPACLLLLLVAAVGGADPSGGAVDHVLFIHVAKTGGTSVREHIVELTTKCGLTFQTHYGHKVGQLPNWDPERPAQVVYGHLVNYGFHRELPPGRRHVYFIMLRSPLPWALSFYTHQLIRTEQQTDTFAAAAWIERFCAQPCDPRMYRAAVGPTPPRSQPLASECANTWFGSLVNRKGESLQSHARRFVILVNEQFDQSIELMSVAFAQAFDIRDLDLRVPPHASSRLNVRGAAAYEKTHISLSITELQRIAVAFAATRLEDLYSEGLRQFSADFELHRQRKPIPWTVARS